MPVMLPPGQGVTVNMPAGAVAQPAPMTQPVAAPAPQPRPEPFRRVAGPDVTLLPHMEEPTQSGPKPPQPPTPSAPSPA